MLTMMSLMPLTAARSPIQRDIPAIARRKPLLPRLSEKLDAFPPFVADTEIGAKFATFYKRGDRAEDGPENDLDEAWVAGGSLYYRSGWLARALRFEVEGFTSQPLVAKEDRGGTLLLEPRQNGYTVLGIANAQVQYAGYRLTGYRQYLDLPYLNRRLNRLTPNTFESITLEKFEGPIRFSVGHTSRIPGRGLTAPAGRVGPKYRCPVFSKVEMSVFSLSMLQSGISGEVFGAVRRGTPARSRRASLLRQRSRAAHIFLPGARAAATHSQSRSRLPAQAH